MITSFLSTIEMFKRHSYVSTLQLSAILQGSISVSALNNSSTSNQNGSASRGEAQSSPGLTSEIFAPCLNSCSPGSAEEVSSQIVAINNETNNGSQPDWVQNCNQAALRKLKIQLSLEDKEDHDVDAEDIPSNSESITVVGVQNEEPGTCRNLVDIFNELEFNEDNRPKETGLPFSSTIDVLKNSESWLEEDQLEAILQSASMTMGENQWFNIREISPEWSYCSESTKVIIAGDFLCDPSHGSWAIQFGDAKVPVEIVQQGVIRCHTPCLEAGKVTMYLIDGNEKACSEAREFEFHNKPTKSMVCENRKLCSEAEAFEFHQRPTESNNERLLLFNYVQLLFDGHVSEQFLKFGLPLPNVECRLQVSPSEIMKGTTEQLNHDTTVNCIMEVLLNNKLEEWLSSKYERNSEGNHFLPRQYHGIIHTIAALGYNWALKLLLNSGVLVNYRDANGWTALHWAARFGREETVVLLLAAGASAGALSDPTAEDPAAKTPSSVAFAHGFKGLSAFLSEAELTTHLHSLESKENGASGGGISRVVDRLSDTFDHVQGGSDNQLALKDSLGAVRNAVQAAGRIQTAFRMFSFRKKQQAAHQNRDSHILSIRKVGAASRGMLEKAALSIQKNFRCWKKRKEFLKIRKNVIKIQARVRAHQQHNKYKDFLRSVGILEKVMLRWYRKGVGLRGFHSEAMPIDEEEEVDIVNVFRKQRVETAISEAVSRVSSIIDSPVAKQQYRRMLEMYQQKKDDNEK
ncbi:calmodulin-binding transcription activator 4-like isoform X2 [Oryza brachyantha]|uniref:calmodulin-binding transcription activator 4-like isoform X2 n=1 Tax=Oryza brachyantha TaxID=4533 RepID=UPI00077638B2|nr:calmodulin-binding transcription activator 4-like isoform X2 [Oryza brachyantha]